MVCASTVQTVFREKIDVVAAPTLQKAGALWACVAVCACHGGMGLGPSPLERARGVSTERQSNNRTL